MIDLSPVGGVVSSLQESKVECLSADKVCSLLPRTEDENPNFTMSRCRMSTSIIFFYVTPADHLSSCPRLMGLEDSCR